MDLSTTYLGLRLPNPLVVGASPLCDDLDMVRRLEEMAGAHAVQLVSALLVHGPRHLRIVHDGVARALDELGYASLAEMRGCMNLARCPDPSALERANYVRVLHSWRDNA